MHLQFPQVYPRREAMIAEPQVITGQVPTNTTRIIILSETRLLSITSRSWIDKKSYSHWRFGRLFKASNEVSLISLLSRNNRFTLPSPLKAFGSIQLMEFLDKYLFERHFKVIPEVSELCL